MGYIFLKKWEGNIPFLEFILFLIILGSAYPKLTYAFAGPDACSACHADIYESWKPSIHARAFSNEKFQESWKNHQKNNSCLACHTTGHKKGTSTFEHSGVSCESCHGALSEGHPGEGKMAIPISSDMCKTCHKKTHQEWKVSKHGQKDIRCFDCHQVHSQGLRAGGGDKLCGSCHSKRLNDFAHSTHHKEGLTCSTCHMPGYANKPDAIEGTGADGHTLSVGAEVCSRCHEEMVHKGDQLPTLRGKVTDFQQQMSVAGVENVYDLNEKVKELEWRSKRLSQSIWVVAILGFLAGLFLGCLGLWTFLRKQGKK